LFSFNSPLVEELLLSVENTTTTECAKLKQGHRWFISSTTPREELL
jgi:hypothetical protein